MKPETMVNAVISGVNDMYTLHLLKKHDAYKHRERQVKAIRAGIALRYKAKEIAIAAYKELVKQQAKRIEELETALPIVRNE